MVLETGRKMGRGSFFFFFFLSTLPSLHIILSLSFFFQFRTAGQLRQPCVTLRNRTTDRVIPPALVLYYSGRLYRVLSHCTVNIMKPYFVYLFALQVSSQIVMARKVISQSTAHGKSHYHAISRQMQQCGERTRFFLLHSGNRKMIGSHTENSLPPQKKSEHQERFFFYTPWSISCAFTRNPACLLA